MQEVTALTISKRRKPLAARTPSGQISRAGEREFPPTQVRRLRDAAMNGLRDPEWGSELGRYYLEGTITSSMYAAGKRWAEYARKYQSAIGVFPVRTSSGQREGHSHPTDPDSKKGQDIAQREADHAERFFAAHAELIAGGALVESTVRRLCEDNQGPVGFDELMKARTGLMRLVSHWDLGGRST